MIRFSNWIISPQREVIARQHDNLTGWLEVLGDLPEGWVWDMLVRVGHYRDVLSLAPCDGGVGIDLSAEMLCVGGSYTMQLRGTQGELVRHTNQVTVYIPASLSGDEWWPELPSEFSQAEQRVRQCVEQATQEANRAESGADAAQKGAEAAKGEANQAEQSAVAAQEANKGSEAAADQAKQSADQAAQEAEAVRETAGVAQEAARLAGQSAAAAQAARDGSEAAASRAGQSADQAAQKADAAASSASDAKKAQQAVENMTASAETLAPDAQASVTKTTQDDVVNLKFGIPQGQPGQNGGYYQPSVSDDGQLAFNPSQEDMPAVPSAYIKGPPGQDAPQIDDSQVSNTAPWSSLQIVDTLAPPFEASGAVVTCDPVAGYPLHVVSQITPVQEGEGDPSPDNVRPIWGWDAAIVTRCGKNLWQFGNQTFTAQKLLVFDNYLPAGTYTFSANISVQENIRGYVLVMYYDSIKGDPAVATSKIKYGGRYSATVVTPRQFNAIYLFSSYDYAPGIGVEATYNDIKLEVGSTATAYEQYRGRTIALPFGQTVYGGEVDWTTGVLTVTWFSVTLTGDENWSGRIAPGGFAYYSLSLSAYDVYPANPSDSSAWLCDALTPVRLNYADPVIHEYSIGFLVNGASISVILDNQQTVDVQSFKQWLQQNQTTLVYKIENPITIQLTPTEVLTLSGTTTIYTDTGDTTVSGREDPITVIRRLSERIAALEFTMNLLSDYQRGDMT